MKELYEHIVEKKQIEAIQLWNKERGSTKYSKYLEYKMLSEEFAEYFEAKELVDKLDAIADFIFVYEGTLYKAYLSNLPEDIVERLTYDCAQMFSIMFENLVDTLQLEHDGLIFNVILETLDIVIEANQQKSANKNVDGKITKPADFVPPEKTIKEQVIDKYKLEG